MGCPLKQLSGTRHMDFSSPASRKCFGAEGRLLVVHGFPPSSELDHDGKHHRHVFYKQTKRSKICSSAGKLYVHGTTVHHTTTPIVVHLPALQNVMVNHFSRQLTNDLGWSVKNTTVQDLFLRWDHPTIELVATKKMSRNVKSSFPEDSTVGDLCPIYFWSSSPWPNVHLFSNSTDPKSTRVAQAEFSQGDHGSSSMAGAVLVLRLEESSSICLPFQPDVIHRY